MQDRLSRRASIGALAVLAVLTALVPAATAGASSTLPTLKVEIKGSTISVSGAEQSGAVNVVSTATGVKEAAVVLFRLKPGVTAADLYAFLATPGARDINNTSKFGSLVFDAEVPSGQTNETQTVLEPGEYVALDAPGEGPPSTHTSFTVTKAAAPAALPTPGATVRSIDFAFKGPVVLHDGELVQFENEGFVVHMDLAFPVKNKRQAKLLVKALLLGHEKLAQKLVAGPPVNFQGPVSTGGLQQSTITAAPGLYVEVCFMDTQDGRSHTKLGMERVIKIAK
jgi:hypothetical protein